MRNLTTINIRQPPVSPACCLSRGFRIPSHNCNNIRLDMLLVKEYDRSMDTEQTMETLTATLQAAADAVSSWKGDDVNLMILAKYFVECQHAMDAFTGKQL